MSDVDSTQYEAHVFVEKWTPEQVATVQESTGNDDPAREDFIAAGIEPNDTTNDVEGA